MSSRSTLELYFANQPTPGLYRTVFQAASNQKPVVGVRGATIPAIGMPFIWGPACHALALLFVSAVKEHLSSEPPALAHLEGPSLSPAGTLARLIQKRSVSWLHDLFSSDVTGRSLLHRIVSLGNPRGKQPGPITAALRTEYLPAANIKIYYDGEDVSKNLAVVRELFDLLNSSFSTRRNPTMHYHKLKSVGLPSPASSSEFGYVLTAEGEI